MKNLLNEIEEKVSQFDWQEDSILRKVSEETECKEVFESICNEIGRYYAQFGIKAFKKKIQLKFDDYKLEVAFSSSGYNQKGDFIWFEINSGVYPNKLKIYYKENNERLLPIVFANVNLLDYKLKYTKEIGFITKGISILGKERIVESKNMESTVEYSRGVNFYKISSDEFKLILKYINRIIRKSIEIVTDKKGLIKYLLNPTQKQIYWIAEERTIDYVNLYYKNDNEIQTRLKELIDQNKNPI